MLPCEIVTNASAKNEENGKRLAKGERQKTKGKRQTAKSKRQIAKDTKKKVKVKRFEIL